MSRQGEQFLITDEDLAALEKRWAEIEDESARFPDDEPPTTRRAYSDLELDLLRIA